MTRWGDPLAARAYDALFARGLERSGPAVHAAVEPLPAGVPRVRAGARAWVRRALDNPALAQLLCWRPVPGFAPATETFAVSVQRMEEVRGARRGGAPGQLRPGAASGPAAGVRFEAVNKVSRSPAWENRPVVTAAQPRQTSATGPVRESAGEP